jgi:tripartite-type tricarboxylate transporter receptor subunit TctC
MLWIAAGALLAAAAGAQQDYPSRPVRIVVPYPPGGSIDYLGRLFAPKLGEALGRQFVVDNRGGGNTIIGNDHVAKSAPDGYTLLVAGSGTITIPHLYRKVPYDVIKDFAPVAGIARSGFVLLTHRSLPAASVADLIALARKRPGELDYATSSIGGPTHLCALQFETAGKVKMQQVPYKGGGPAMTDLLGGQVQIVFANPASAMAFITAGRMRALAVTGEKRLEMLPQVPTFAEAGLPGVTTTNWYAFTAPAGTPPPIVDRLAAAIQRAAATADVKAALTRQGLESYYATPDQLDRLRRDEFVAVGKLIKAAGIKIQD